MIQAKCIQKFRDNSGKIYGYRLIDLNGQTQDVTPDNLKAAIANNQIHVINLTLTKDKRLVDTAERHLQSKSLGNKPVKEYKGLEKKYRDIIEYIAQKTQIKFDYSSYEYRQDDKNKWCTIKSEEFTRLKVQAALTIINKDYEKTDIEKAKELNKLFGVTYNENTATPASTRLDDNISIKVSLYSNNGYLEFADIEQKNRLSNIDKIISFINKHKNTINEVKDEKSLLSLASYLSFYMGETHEIMIEQAIKALETEYNINTHDEIQRRIDTIKSNTKEMEHIKNIIISAKDEIYNTYSVDLADTETFNTYVNLAIYYEALFSEKITDCSSVYILNCESNYKSEFRY